MVVYSKTMTTACIHPVLVPFPAAVAAGIGIESVATTVATDVEAVATRTARASGKASENARKKFKHEYERSLGKQAPPQPSLAPTPRIKDNIVTALKKNLKSS
jgi:hypothetical protein